MQALALQPADVAPVLPRSAHPALETNDVDDYLNIALQLCFEKSQPGGAVLDEWAQPADDFLSSFSIRYWIAHGGSVQTHVRSLWKRREGNSEVQRPGLIGFLEVQNGFLMDRPLRT